MKAVIKFDLDDPDDQMAYKRMNLAEGMAFVLWELQFNSKRNIERALEAAADDKVDRFTALDMCFERLNELLLQHDINIESLVQ